MEKRNTIWFLVAILLVISIFPAEAKMLYVDGSTGSDIYTYAQNDAAHPWATIGRAAWGSTNRAAPNAAEAARAGDDVIVRAGTYTTTGTDSRQLPAYNPANSGTPGNPITFQAEEGVVLTYSSGAGPVIGALNRNYIIWRGFTIDEHLTLPHSDTGPVVLWTSTGCIIEDNVIIGYGSLPPTYPTYGSERHNGIQVDDGGYHIIRNNIISGFTAGTGSGNQAAILIDHGGSGIIEHNTIFGNAAGLSIKRNYNHPGRWIMRYNDIYNCITGIDVNQLALTTANPANTVDIYQNLLRNISGFAFTTNHYENRAAQYIRFVNNVIDSCDYAAVNTANLTENAGHKFFNNIVVDCPITQGSYRMTFLMWEYASDLSSAVYHANNNIYRNPSSNFATVGHENYQNISRISELSFAQWQAIGQDVNSHIDTDPGFVNDANSDYRLNSNSPARTLGFDILDLDNDGSTTDMIPAGAYIAGNEVIGRIETEAQEPNACSEASVRCVDDSIGANQEYASIQACANVAVAGDTCLVWPGLYNESVIPATSGTEENPIIYKANGEVILDSFRISQKNYIRIEGFEITDMGAAGSNGVGIYISGSNGTHIISNYIHHTRGLGIWLHVPSTQNNNIIIRLNNISFPGAVPFLVGNGAINAAGNNLLIENNDISHVGDFTNVWGYYNVIRNNFFHDCHMSDFPGNPMTEGHHVDGIQYYSTAGTSPFRFLLFENNTFDNIVMSNGHAAILRNVEGRNDSDAIFRYNTMYRAGESAIGMSPFDGVRIYNNDIINVANDPRIADIPGAYSYATRSRYTIEGYNSGAGITRNIKITNNLFYNSTRQDSISRPYYIDPASTSGFHADYNLAYLSGSYQFNELHGIIDISPSLNDYPGKDFTLSEDSVAIDAGGPLTTVSQQDSGTGNTLTVTDARYFHDGWAGTEPDWIAVGNSGNAVQIESIDYDTNTITLANHINRNEGEPVWLYKDSNGRRVLYGSAPDIGAYEYESTTSQQPILGDINFDGNVNLADLQVVVNTFGRTTSESGFDSRCDLAAPFGRVDLFDVMIVVRNWG